MAAEVRHRRLSYLDKKSPGKEDVVWCLKSTRKGKLAYNSNGGSTSASTENGRSVQFDGDRLVISLSSPPDGRNRESILVSDDMTKGIAQNNERNVRRVVKFPKKEEVVSNVTRTVKNKRNGRGNGKRMEKSPTEALMDNESICISKNDVLDLVKDRRIFLEEKARMEAREMKQNFLSGLNQISDDAKLEEKYACDSLHAQHISDLHELEETIMKAKSRSEDDLKKLLQQHQKRQLIVSKTMQAIVQRQEEIELEKRRQEEAHQKLITLSKNIESVLIRIRDLATETLKELDSHKGNVYVSNEVKGLKTKAENLFAEAVKIGNKAIKQQDKLEETLEYIQRFLQSMKLIKENVVKGISEAEAKAKEEEKRKEIEQKAAVAKELEAKQEEKQKEQETKDATLKKDELIGVGSTKTEALKLFVSPIAFEHYQEILEFKKEVAASVAQFKSSKDRKSLRFDLTKVINTAINATSDQSPEHLLDKIQRLTKLLKGDTVELGDKKVSATSNPYGLAYCKDTVAKKLVLQGAQQISSNFSSAFAFGAVALGIWSQFPDVGRLILAHFYLACPYLVPYYMPRKDGQSVAEYCKSLGYAVDGDEVESEDKYQKKLSGIVRLYAAILQSPMPQALSSMPHPFGIHNAWTWISRVVNLEVRECATATILHDFLEVAGYSLSKNFGKQFQKLLQLLHEQVVPRIDQITESDNKGSVMRLKSFLGKSLKSSTFPIPDGHISARWWKSNRGSSSLF